GKGTVSLDDFDQTELVISIGHNPGTNHPRMMGTLHELSRRDVLFMNEQDMAAQGLEHGDRVDIHTALPGSALTLEDITVVAYG
ncbi:hypothetical protein PXW85_26665, partial [Klebsiella pneumoniae]|uniref:hypothetical protein n=1 Tax=Klebsiella pneumoniae TaxID=573 RepID=UPI00238169A9